MNVMLMRMRMATSWPASSWACCRPGMLAACTGAQARARTSHAPPRCWWTGAGAAYTGLPAYTGNQTRAHTSHAPLRCWWMGAGAAYTGLPAYTGTQTRAHISHARLRCWWTGAGARTTGRWPSWGRARCCRCPAWWAGGELPRLARVIDSPGCSHSARDEAFERGASSQPVCALAKEAQPAKAACRLHTRRAECAARSAAQTHQRRAAGSWTAPRPAQQRVRDLCSSMWPSAPVSMRMCTATPPLAGSRKGGAACAGTRPC